MMPQKPRFQDDAATLGKWANHKSNLSAKSQIFRQEELNIYAKY